MRQGVAFLVLLVAVLAACVPGCERAPGTATGTSRPLNVVASVGMVADLVEKVGGDRVKVRTLIGAGVDPHLYKPTRDDIAALMSADLVLYSGLMLEGKMGEAFERVRASGKPVVAVAESIDEAQRLQKAGEHTAIDPHVWMDPLLWSFALDRVREALTRALPDGEAQFMNATAALTREFNELNAYGQRSIATIPESSRVLITAHDAFGYFGRRFGMDVVGIQGISTESEAGVRDIERLVDMIVTRKIAAVFVETTVSERNINALIEGAQARGQQVRIGGRLFSDAMGPAGMYEGTYVGMIDHNITTIVRGLGGDAPARGMQGKLIAVSEVER